MRNRTEDFIQLDTAAEVEAQLELQGAKMGVRAFAKRLSVSPSTITRWRDDLKRFRRKVDFHKSLWEKVLRDEYFEKIRKSESLLSGAECFQ